MVSATQGLMPRGAAEATLVFPNMGAPGTTSYGTQANLVACSGQGMLNAYEYLAQQDVTTANESFDCPPNSMGVTEDYYARYADMSVFHASGNNGNAFTSQFDGTQGACTQDPNGICVGGVNAEKKMSCFSVWENPFEQGSTTVRSDREEPDLVALAGDANGMSGFAAGCSEANQNEFVQTIGVPGATGWLRAVGTTDWSGDVGTSFASPAMASVAALTKEACGGSLDHLLMRAILRTAAWGFNPADYPYSTPGPGEDWKDGAGGLFATAVLPFCGIGTGSNPTVASGNVNVSLNSGGTLPAGAAPDAGSPPPGGCLLAPCGAAQSAQGGVHIDSYTPPGPNDGRVGGSFLSLFLNAGERLRVTFSWDACPVGMTGTAPDTVSSDIDIFLYSEDNAAYLYTSQSIADDNEGFDVTIPDSWGGRFTLYYGVIPTPGCNGATSEPSAWAAEWGQF